MSELTHQGAQRLIYQARLNEAERHDLHEHLSTCPECRQNAIMFGVLENHLALQTLPTRPSPRFTAVYKASAARRSRRSHIMKPVYAVGGAVALALIVLAGWFIVRGNPETTTLEAVPVQTIISTVSEQIVAAVAAGDAAEVKRLLDAGAGPDTIDAAGDPILRSAISESKFNGSTDIVEMLLAHGADVNTLDRNGDPLLPDAAMVGQLEVVQLLLNAGADVNQIEPEYNRTALHGASWYNHVEIVKILLENGADPNPVSAWSGGETPLHFAARNGSIEAAQLLLDGGADVDSQTDKGVTPLMSADTLTKSEMVSFLLESGANPDFQDSYGNAALHAAAGQGKSAAIPILIEHGATIDLQNNLGETALHRAAQSYHSPALEILIEQGASLDIKNNEDETALDVAGNSDIEELLRAAGAGAGTGLEANAETLDEQLSAAVGDGDAAEVEQLLGAGAIADAEDSLGNAALAVAAGDGQLEIVKLLLDAGADVNGTVAAGSSRAGGNFGSTRGAMKPGVNESALSEAVINDHIEIVQLLIAYGVDLNYAEDNGGATALHRAAMLINPEIIKILLASGADPSPSSNLGFGETPLHYAGYRASQAAAQALLEGGADVDAQTEEGMTPMMTALAKGSADDGSFITLLLENGADPNIEDSGIGNTALHYAARQGRTNNIPILIEHGVNINQQNGGGNTALHQAAKWERTRSVQTLIENGADVNILNSRDQTALDIAANERIAETLREAGATNGTQQGTSSLDEQIIAAVAAKDSAAVEQLINGGASPDAVDSAGDPILKSAITQRGEQGVDIVRLLLDNGADANAVDNHGYALFPFAALAGNYEIVELMLDAGADVDGIFTSQYFTNDTALGTAAFKDYKEIVELLIARGADVNHVETGSGYTPLGVAAYSNNHEIVVMLLENGADHTIPANFGGGQTPLHGAARQNAVEAVQALLDGGAEVEARTDSGLTPLVLLMSDGYRIALTEITALLLDGGADPNAQDDAGNSALHYAAIRGIGEAVPLLIERGASVDLQNNEGQTVVDLAKNEEILELLQEGGAAE